MDFKQVIDWIKNFENQVQKSNNLLYTNNKNQIPVSMTNKLKKLLDEYNSFKKGFVTLYKKLNKDKYDILKNEDINMLFKNFDEQIHLIKNNNYAEKSILQNIKQLKNYSTIFVKMYVKQYNLELNFD